MRHLADALPDFGPLFELPERDAPNLAPSRLSFEGPEEDNQGAREFRLGSQLEEIFWTIRDGNWRTLEELERQTGHPATSISAQLRHLRKKHFGGFLISKRHVGGGLWEYRLELDSYGRPRRSE